MKTNIGLLLTACTLFAGTYTGISDEGMATDDAKAVLSTGVVDEPVVGAVFAGGSAREDAFYAYAGAIHSLSGDLNDNGFVAKVFVGGGQYYYDTVGVPDGDVDGSILDFSASVGYQYYVAEGWKASLAVGVHVKDRFLDENDLGNQGSSGTKVGAKIDGGINGSVGPVDLEALAQYSTVKNGIWTRVRAGYNTGLYSIKIGPEYIFLHDDTFREHRVGGFIGYQLTSDIGVTLSLGYADYKSDSVSSGSSIYGGAGFVWAY